MPNYTLHQSCCNSGSIRRPTTSKTMCVDEVVTSAVGLKPILKHFKLSGENSTLLNKALEIQDAKQFKLMTWCPTRMCNLLQCSSRTVAILFPLCNTLTTARLKKEQSDYFLSPICLSILHMFADLDKLFVGLYFG